MLTGKMVRVRYARDRIIPHYINTADPSWLETAERMLEMFRGREGKTRGELDDEQREAFGDDPGQLVHQGLAKLLEDRCEFEVDVGRPAGTAARRRLPRRGPAAQGGGFASSSTATAVLAEVAAELGLTPEAVDQGLFADLKSEQRLTKFKDITAERLLQRYNVALAQAVLLRSTRVHVVVRNEPPQRYRQLLRLVKFHRLVCELERLGPDSFRLHLDGPMSLFSATQKYGLQLALFLPAVLLCRDFELEADLRWGPQRKPKKFLVTPGDGLVSHTPDHGMYTPPELAMFVELFRKRVADWELTEETELLPLGDGFWAPDFRLIHKGSGLVVYAGGAGLLAAVERREAPGAAAAARARAVPAGGVGRTAHRRGGAGRTAGRHPPLPQHAAAG